MSCTEDTLTVQTNYIKVSIHCDACIKKVKRVLRKIDGVYKNTIDKDQGKLTVSGVVDADTIVKKLTKAGMPSMLWGSTSDVASQSQELRLGDSGKDQPNDDDEKGHKSKEGGGSSSASGAKDANLVQPQSMTQQIQRIQQQMQQMVLQVVQQMQQLQQLKQQVQQLQMKVVVTLPPQRMDGKMPFPVSAAVPAMGPKSVRLNLPEGGLANEGKAVEDEISDDEDSEDDDLSNFNSDQMMMMKAMVMPSGSGGGSKKGGASGENNGGKKVGSWNMIPMLTNKVNANNAGDGGEHSGGEQSQGSRGGNINNGGRRKKSVGQPQQNIVLGKANLPARGKKDPMGGQGSGLMGGMQPQLSMTRPNATGSMQPHTGMMRVNTLGGMPSRPTMDQIGSRPMSMPTGQPHMGTMHQGEGGTGGAMNGMSAGSMLGEGSSQGGGNGMLAGQEMMQAAAGAGNLMVQKQYMAMVQQQQQTPQPPMMMNGQAGYPGHQGQGGARYPTMPMGYGYGNQPLQHPTAYLQLPPSHVESYNIFSDENPNSSCSVM